MPGIDPEIIMHQLQVDPSHHPTRHKRRKFAPERDIIINEEVKNLLEAGFIREVQYPEWLANVVVSRKKTEIGGSASTSQTSTNHVQRILSVCHTSINLSILRLDTG